MYINPIKTVNQNRLVRNNRPNYNNFQLKNVVSQDVFSFKGKKEVTPFENLQSGLFNVINKPTFRLENVQKVFDEHDYDVEVQPLKNLKTNNPFIKAFFVDSRVFDDEKLEFVPQKQVVFLKDDKFLSKEDKRKYFASIVHESTHVEQAKNKRSLYDFQGDYYKNSTDNEDVKNSTMNVMSIYLRNVQSMISYYSQSNAFAFSLGLFDKEDSDNFFGKAINDTFEEINTVIPEDKYNKKVVCDLLKTMADVELEAYNQEKEALKKYFGVDNPSINSMEIALYTSFKDSVEKVK